MLRLLGPFSVRRDGAEVERSEFGGRLAQSLLRLLATRRGSLVARDVLVDALWPDHPPADPMANLNVLASRIRKATAAPWLVKAAGGGYLLPTTDDCVIDAEQFLAEVTDGGTLLAAGDSAAALKALQAALARWHGEPLVEDLYADWAQPYRRLLCQQRLIALEDAATAALMRDNPAVALRLAEQAVDADPLRESGHLLRVRALAAGGDPARAAAAFTAFRNILAADTGLEPSPAARDLQRRLLRGELATPRYRLALHRRPPSASPAIDDVPFVGREQELRTVLAHLGGHEPVRVVLVGVAGVGKSRLLAEIARLADRPALVARAFRAERDGSWSFAGHLLREALALDMSAADALPARIASALADLLPELADLRRVPVLTLEPDSRRALISEGALRLLVACRPSPILLLDDVQWADASSRELIERIGERLTGVRMVLACRSGEAGTGNLADVLSDTATARLLIEPLRPEAIGHLVADQAVASALAHHTDRTPMAIIEVVRALARQGMLTRTDDSRWLATTPGIAAAAKDIALQGQRRAIARRAAEQPGEARKLLRMLALLGRETPARVLADALGVTQQVVLGRLDELTRAGLVRLGERGWATAHDLISESVVDTLQPATVGALHGLLARALATNDADQAEIAQHLAGAGDTNAAAQASIVAARAALDRFANTEARRIAGAGLALQPNAVMRAALLETRAEAHARTGDLTAAGDDLRSALMTGVTGPARARLLARHARLAAGTEDLRHAGELVRLALAETEDEPLARAAALYAGAIVDMNTDRPDRARRRWDEAMRLYDEAGDARGVTDILDARAMATCLDGRNRDAIVLFDQVARLFADTGDLLRVVTPRSTRGHCLVFLGEPAKAIAETEQALDLARSLDHLDGITYALWHRSEALTALDRADDGEADAREAIGVAERLGHHSWIASAHRALGVALQASGDLTAAERSFHRSLELSTHWPLFASWACARIALIRIANGDLDAAGQYVSRAIGQGPPLAHYEARLAQIEFAVATSSPEAETLAREALALARSGGHLVAVPRLEELAGMRVTPP